MIKAMIKAIFAAGFRGRNTAQKVLKLDHDMKSFPLWLLCNHGPSVIYVGNLFGVSVSFQSNVFLTQDASDAENK